MARTGKPASRRVAAVERAVAVLDALAEGELGTNEVARRTGMTASSASRQLATLAATGLVEHLEETGRYRLGPRLVELGNAALGQIDLLALARPHLRALVDATGETATLSVPGSRDAVTVDFVQSRQSVQSVAELGRPSVGHATATGKVMLAHGGSLPVGKLERFTPGTVVDRRKLELELERVRKRGYATAVEEREPGLTAMATPVFGSGGELVAILGVQGPAERFRGLTLERAKQPLREAAHSLSRSLGAHVS
ncbi:MAG: IclR family transcriptional regulator [Actinomycetota bacterium]|nr:IclR family transcriptional regulator [Actinomycetota bacterium]